MVALRSSVSENIEFLEFVKLSRELGAVDESTARKLIEFARLFGGVARVPWFSKDLGGGRVRLEDALVSYLPASMNFGNFIVSAANRFAHETARTLALIKWTWSAISPLLIFGGTGLGKTHLLSAVSRSFAGDSVYLDTADLAIQLQYAADSGIALQLKNWILAHDMLLLDDLHLAGGDEKLQKLLHTVLGSAMMKGMAVVIVCNSHPSILGELDESLVSRAASGTVASLGMPDLHGRIEVLRRLFGREGVAVDPEIERFIAERATHSVRQLTSAGKSLISEMMSMGGVLNMRRAVEVLESLGIIDPEKHDDFSETCSLDRLPGMQEAVGGVSGPGGADSSKPAKADVFRDMIDNAESVDQLCEALSLAVRKRLEQISGYERDEGLEEMILEALDLLERRRLYEAMECFDRIDLF